MALLFMDGVDHYASLTHKWSSSSGASVSAGSGRFSPSDSIRFTGSGEVYKFITMGDNKHIMGFAYRSSSVTSGNGRIAIFGATQNMELYLLSTGKLGIYRAGVQLAVSTLTLSPNVYYFIEWMVVRDSSAGQVQLQVNGVDWIPLTSSLNTGSANATLVYVYSELGAPTQDFCDIRVQDGTGSSPLNAMLGDTKIETLRPTGAGNSAAWTPSAGSNYQNVDDTTPNDDTDYNSSSTTGQRDTFAFGDLSISGGSVFAVQHVLRARKTDAGLRQVAPVIRQGSTDYDGTTVTLPSSYLYTYQLYPLDPTGAAWSISNVNADEYGYKMVA